MDQLQPRRRAIVNQLATSWDGAAAVSAPTKDSAGIAQHQISVLCDATPSVGTLRVMGQPKDGSGWARIDELVALDLTAGSISAIFSGFYEAYRMDFTDPLVGASSIDVVMHSVGQELLPFGGVREPEKKRILVKAMAESWDGTTRTSRVDEHASLTQHQLSVTCSAEPSAGVLCVRGRPPEQTRFVVIHDDLEAIDIASLGAASVIFVGLFDAYELTFTTPLTGATVSVYLHSIGEELFRKSGEGSAGVFPLSAGPISHQWLASYDATTGNFTLTQPSAQDLSNGVTGTGAVVLADSPTLTGTPLAPTPAAGDSSTKIATTEFVHNMLASFDAKPAVAYCSTSALPANTYSNGTLGVGATLTGSSNGPLLIDGVSLTAPQVGERVLVAGEAASARNGWYTITQVGVVAVSPYILTRSIESDQASEIAPGYLTAVEAPSGLTPGSANNSKVFISIAPVPITVGTDAITFAAIGVSATPAGSDTQLQFNNSGVFGASPYFTVDFANGYMKIGDSTGALATGNLLVYGDIAPIIAKSLDPNGYSSIRTYNSLGRWLEFGYCGVNGNHGVSVLSGYPKQEVGYLSVPSAHDLVLATSNTARVIITDSTGAVQVVGNITANNLSGTNTGDQTLGGLGGQPLDATLTALAAANWAANALPIGTGSDTLSQTTFAANTFPARASSGNLAAKTITDFGLSLVDDATASDSRTTLGLTIGTNVQAWDTQLDSLAGLSYTGNTLKFIRVNSGETGFELATPSASVADADYGDVSVSGGVWTIDANVVTYAKMQDITSASRLLGRGSASGSGDPQEISLGAGLTMTGTSLSAVASTITSGSIGLILALPYALS